MRLRRAKRLTVLAIVASLVCAAGAYAAVAGLPAGVQVNNDLPAIDPAQDAGLADLTAGTVTAGNARVPWVTFSQQNQKNADGSQQIFVRAFKGGAWQTQGFPESLNEDTTQIAQAPSIDFTGADRTVPWVGWAEPSTVLGSNHQIFASRFSPQPAPAQGGGQWIHEGQQVTGTAPSLNINTNRDAAAPSLIGGTTNAGANPAPWLTWQEFDGQQGECNTTACAPQIFGSHAVPATAGACPAGTKPSHGSSVGKFCFQQVGIDRVQGPGADQLDPSLNIDPSRAGIEGDIAFTGANDAVPWAVWYENSDSNGGHPSGHGLFNADMVFAARAIPDGSGDGGFHWQAVGLGTAGKTAANDILNTSGGNGIGECGQSTANEQACSLDAASASGLDAGTGAENPSVTAGTMVAGKATTPWIAWDESTANGGLHSVFVARLDAAGDHFDLLNNGQPISHSGLDSTRPDIVFSHSTPYVSWHEKAAEARDDVRRSLRGDPPNPVFKIDTGAIPTTTPLASDDSITDWPPVGSTCPADPSPRTVPDARQTRSARPSSRSRPSPMVQRHSSRGPLEPEEACGPGSNDRGGDWPGDGQRVRELLRRTVQVRVPSSARRPATGRARRPSPWPRQRPRRRSARRSAACLQGRCTIARSRPATSGPSPAPTRPHRSRLPLRRLHRRLETATHRSGTPRSRARPRAYGCPAPESQERPASSRSG